MNIKALPLLAALVLAACGGGNAIPPEVPQDPPKTLTCGAAKTYEFRATAFAPNFLGRIGHVDALPAGLYQLEAVFYTAPALNSEAYIEVSSSDGRILAEALIPVEPDGRAVFPGAVFSMASSIHGAIVAVRLPNGGVIEDQAISIRPCTQKSAVL